MTSAKPKIFGKALSRQFLRYYLGPDHPGKLRLWNWIFRRYGLRLTLPYEGDNWITLDLSDPVEYGILHHGGYEPEVWNTMKTYARPGDVVWDVGANIGGVALRAAAAPEISQVCAFEPHPYTYGVLKHHAEINRHRKLKPFNFALSDQSGEAVLGPGGGHNRGQSSLAQSPRSDAANDQVTVTCRTADEVVAQGLAAPPNLMKIDVEGWEANVLRGATSLLRDKPPRAIVFESRYQRGADDVLRSELEDFFRNHGYRTQHIPRAYPGLEAVENFVAVR